MRKILLVVVLLLLVSLAFTIHLGDEHDKGKGNGKTNPNGKGKGFGKGKANGKGKGKVQKLNGKKPLPAAEDLLPDEPSKKDGVEFLAKFGKKYSGDKHAYRVHVFQLNKAKYDAHNKKSTKSKFGTNKFSDLTNIEFAASHLTLRLPADFKPKPVKPLSHHLKANSHLAEVNWVEQGMITDVRDQGQCGSCWAFSTLGALEGALLINNGETTDLSEQELVDCSGDDYGNAGCDGGWMGNAFAYIMDNGISSEYDYPYQAEDLSCDVQTGQYSITDYKEGEDCDVLEEALALGPVSVTVDASEWSGYKSGVFGDCGNDLNHAVLLVGATADEWLIKNSWGADWGECGYIRLESGDTCGVCEAIVYPTL